MSTPCGQKARISLVLVPGWVHEISTSLLNLLLRDLIPFLQRRLLHGSLIEVVAPPCSLFK